jgi:hypothetical protein
MRNIVILCTVILLFLLPAVGCAKAKFEVSALNVAPSDVVSGETATVSADVENTGGADGVYLATLTIDAVEIETKEISLAPGARETITFVVAEESPGTYQVAIGELTGSLRVLRPAEFVVSDLALRPSEAEVWEEVTVTAKVQNVGEAEGTYAGTLKIDGAEVEIKDISVAGGATETLSFTVIRDVGPCCDIKIGDLTETLTIREGILPTFEIGDKWVSNVLLEGINYTMTEEVTGEKVIDGKDCYVTLSTFEPPLMGNISEISIMYDKATLCWERLQMSGEVQGEPFVGEYNYTDEFLGEPLYPLEIGKECKVKETYTLSVQVGSEIQQESHTETFTYKVEEIEEITVPAGTFRCFKIVKYDHSDNEFNTFWQSDKVKQYNVKFMDHLIGEVDELVSYSVN